ncbi:MAG: hypothetical protein HQL30_09480 [Candidatus Omnitrophica bacterium]|nr:hypothetical protein [Candidatus Omnitrophota bacterium]
MYKHLLKALPFCLGRALLVPALGVVAVIATIAYVAKKSCETSEEPK